MIEGLLVRRPVSMPLRDPIVCASLMRFHELSAGMESKTWIKHTVMAKDKNTIPPYSTYSTLCDSSVLLMLSRTPHVLTCRIPVLQQQSHQSQMLRAKTARQRCAFGFSLTASPLPVSHFKGTSWLMFVALVCSCEKPANIFGTILIYEGNPH